MSKPEIVVVTGASAGLGRAIVRAFAQEGAHVGLIARGRDGLEGACREVEELGWAVRPLCIRRTWPTPRKSRTRLLR